MSRDNDSKGKTMRCSYCGKTQENRERQKKRKSVEKVVDKCHFR